MQPVMVEHVRHLRTGVVFAVALTGAVALAQDGPVAMMFRADLKREPSLALSFLPIELPGTASSSALHVYLSAGDLERAFDTAAFRPDAAIVPTNTGLVITAATPSTQRVLVERVQRQPQLMAELQKQIAARRTQTPAGGDGTVLQIGVDTFMSKLSEPGQPADNRSPLPRMVCLIATDFPTGGAVDRRELFAQDRVRKGVAECLEALDVAGASSVTMPMLGAASARTQSNDPVYEGQRLLKECRHLNAIAGIALGIHDFAPRRRTIREIGIVQWNREIADMFGSGRLGQAAYRLYAEQIKQAVNKGIAGEKTTAADAGGSCSTTFGG